MFEVGFSELIMVGLVSLLVIGPERLPKVARVAGYWLGKMQQMIANVKVEIAQELHAEEIRQLLKANQEIDFNDNDKTTVNALPPKTEQINTSEKTHE